MIRAFTCFLLQHSSSLSGIPENISRDPRRQIISARINDVLEPATRPSNLVRLTDKNVASAASGQSQAFSTSLDQISKVEEASASVTQVTFHIDDVLFLYLLGLNHNGLLLDNLFCIFYSYKDTEISYGDNVTGN